MQFLGTDDIGVGGGGLEYDLVLLLLDVQPCDVTAELAHLVAGHNLAAHKHGLGHGNPSGRFI